MVAAGWPPLRLLAFLLSRLRTRSIITRLRWSDRVSVRLLQPVVAPDYFPPALGNGGLADEGKRPDSFGAMVFLSAFGFFGSRPLRF